MRAIRTADLTPSSLSSESEKLWVYNGLDCCVTLEVLEAMLPQLDNQTRTTYEFEKALQGPVIEMNMRGILVDQEARNKAINTYQTKLTFLEHNLNRILSEGVGVNINWRSPHQLKTLFYKTLGFAEVIKRGKVTVDRDALEKLESYFYAGPIVRHLLAMRDVAKKISVLKTGIDTDGRMRTSISIAGTSTGRFSSAMGDFESGGNLQNIEEQLRRIFIADPGMKFAYIDLEQAESRAVGAIEWNLFHYGRYLDACESGDLHTTVCKMTNPDLPWTGDPKQDKDVAESPFYRQHSYRHMNKVLGHGSNYDGKPWTMAKHTKMGQKIIAAFQEKYFAAFPHKVWHQHVREHVVEDGYLISLTGRRRWFFGRRTEDSTIREAIAYDPQGSVGDILNTGMLQVWRLHICQLLLQIHDAILIQYPEDQEDTIIPKVVEAIKVPIELKHGRTLIIPCDVKTGWNWSNYLDEKGQADFKKKNPDLPLPELNLSGLKKYKGHDSRKRQVASTSLLDRIY